MKYILALLVFMISAAQAEVHTYLDRDQFLEDLGSGSLTTIERFNGAAWQPTKIVDIFNPPLVLADISAKGFRWWRDSAYVVTSGSGKNTMMRTWSGQSGVYLQPSGYSVSVVSSLKVTCGFGADFNTNGGITHFLRFTTDNGVVPFDDDDTKLDHARKFIGFIDTDCFQNLTIEDVGSADDGAFLLSTYDAVLGRPSKEIPVFSITPIEEEPPLYCGGCPPGQWLDPENGACEDL